MRHTFDAALTAKPGRPSTGGAAAGWCPHVQAPPPVDPNPTALPHYSGPTSSASATYARDSGVAIGEGAGCHVRRARVRGGHPAHVRDHQDLRRAPSRGREEVATNRVNDNDPGVHNGRRRRRRRSFLLPRGLLPQGDAAGGTGRCGTGKGV
ncbi:unnamed protein product [Ectocarpus fasciculatus]